MTRILGAVGGVLLVLLGAGCTDGGSGGAGSEAGADRDLTAFASHLFVWTTDSDSMDLNYLAVLDADPASPGYGTVTSTRAVQTEGRTRGHHTEHEMPVGNVLFANDFGTGITYLLDLNDPDVPGLAGSFVTAGPLTSPHSFQRLENGNVLATFQNEGPGNRAAGGIAELDPEGVAVRWASAAVEGLYIRPYSLAVVPVLDRVVTSSSDMRGEGDSRAIQIWRLSDLSLVATLIVPDEWGPTMEPRVLSDGASVLVSTYGCSLIQVHDLDGESPSLSLAYSFAGSSCAVPAVVGNLWIQTVPDAHGLVAIDVSDPDSVREVARLTMGPTDWPHWISVEPGHRRLVVTGYAGTRHRVIMVNLDPVTGAMTLDSTFGSTDPELPGVSFRRDQWPHGATGPGDPHGAVFSRR